MPFYDYKCDKCGKVSEILHGMSEKPANLKCSFCNSAKLSRVFYPIGTMNSSSDSSSGGSKCSSCSSGSCGSCH